jgi:protein CWC15
MELLHLEYRTNGASDDDEDETAELQRELEKIKRERAEKREQEVRTNLEALPTKLRLTPMQEREKAAAEEAAREHDIALGNPLLNPKSDFNVKRRYVAAKRIFLAKCGSHCMQVG